MADTPQRRPRALNRQEDVTANNLRRIFDYYDERFRLLERENVALKQRIETLETSP